MNSIDETESIQEPTGENNIGEAAPPIIRRDLLKSIAKFGTVGVLAIALGVRRVSAGNFCYFYWEYQPRTACTSWTRKVTVCNGVIASYGAWGITSRNNCAHFGKGSRCCG